MKPAAIIHAIAGAPAMPAAITVEHARCWLCATTATRVVHRRDFSGANFTDQNKCRAAESPYVCEPCAWACSWVPPPGWVETRTDAKRTPMLRSYTHLWHEGDYRWLTKAQKPEVRAWLRSPKVGRWFAAIADSGQKHTLPWTPVNVGSGRGRVRFEECTLWVPDADGWQMVDDLTELLTLGVTKEELGRGEYRMNTWRYCPDELRRFDARWATERGGNWWTLALWLAQRDEARHAEIVAERKRNGH